MGLFTIIALGEIVVGVTIDNQGIHTWEAYVGSGLGIVLAMVLKWYVQYLQNPLGFRNVNACRIYFDMEFEEHEEHAIRRTRWTVDDSADS